MLLSLIISIKLILRRAVLPKKVVIMDPTAMLKPSVKEQARNRSARGLKIPKGTRDIDPLEMSIRATNVMVL